LSLAIINLTYGILDFADPFIQKYPMLKQTCLSNELTPSELKIPDGPATIPEQFATGPDSGNADRKIGIPQQSETGSESCFKASMPGFFLGSHLQGCDRVRSGEQDGDFRAWALSDYNEPSIITRLPDGVGIFLSFFLDIHLLQDMLTRLKTFF
jgi:hypothetical protein